MRNVILLEINTKGSKEHKIMGNIKKTGKYIHKHLEAHYIDYTPKDFWHYSSLVKNMTKSKTKVLEKQTKESYIIIKKLPIQ